MKLGRYNWDLPVFLAPMAGVTDKAFRETVRLVGGKYTVTEMISAKALNYQNCHTLHMLEIKDETEPRIVQLFGSDPDNMAQAAKLAESLGADVLDINMGCPTPKIVKNREGAALLRDPSLATKIAAAVVQAVNLPVTVKIRLGWTKKEIIAAELANRLESVGVSMITVHARTREQFYAGQAEWEWIRRVKEITNVPVIGNGDITNPEQALQMIEQTGCDGVMIGRGALGNPWLIPQIQHYLKFKKLLSQPALKDRITMVLQHFEYLIEYKGNRIGLNEMRKHAAWYVKGFKNAAALRNRIMQTRDIMEMKDLFCRIADKN
ncbi:MAG: tRNA dihydrouridine synthase DusB [Desulfitobacteriaceae bacterium]|nr:tRNA dihydrouridine synthase DusB [Desulfitobacteriaceae bacterium]MDD4346053.1 tRNA dihydrouridine synthase DusB [Desulfitobacteriaceae bacterium]MDD4401321.1 tRNA dihydrouridine synthase DusB [Desulfitobacteriaceae bacterium]